MTPVAKVSYNEKGHPVKGMVFMNRDGKVRAAEIHFHPNKDGHHDVVARRRDHSYQKIGTHKTENGRHNLHVLSIKTSTESGSGEKSFHHQMHESTEPPKAHILHGPDGSPQAGHLIGHIDGKTHRINLRFARAQGEGTGHRIYSTDSSGKHRTIGTHRIKDGHHEVMIKGHVSRTKVNPGQRFVPHHFQQEAPVKEKRKQLATEAQELLVTVRDRMLEESVVHNIASHGKEIYLRIRK